MIWELLAVCSAFLVEFASGAFRFRTRSIRTYYTPSRYSSYYSVYSPVSTWIIVVSVIGSLVVAGVVLVIICCCVKSRATQGRVISTTTTAPTVSYIGSATSKVQPNQTMTAAGAPPPYNHAYDNAAAGATPPYNHAYDNAAAYPPQQLQVKDQYPPVSSQYPPMPQADFGTKMTE